MASSTAAPTKSVQPEWHQPALSAASQPQLHVYNSLTRTKTAFVPLRPNQLTWYNCGPTVYDASHMGHARNYVTIDIIRRIMRDYFRYDVNFVMNITDVDDKIIVRARHSYLLGQYASQNPTLSKKVLDDVRKAWQVYLDKTVGKIAPPAAPLGGEELKEGTLVMAEAKFEEVSRLAKDPNWVKQTSEKEPRFGMWLTGITSSRQAQIAAAMTLAGETSSSESSQPLLNASADLLSSWLDSAQGPSVSDPSIFRQLAAKWEDEFFKDMKRLNVEQPTTLTRVSEYLPEIVEFVEKIVARGYAYEDSGYQGDSTKKNVWFDTKAFDGAKEKEPLSKEEDYIHSYAKLAPWNKGNRELLEEGEGSLSTGAATTSGKRSAADFALWKASKPGEPAWPSPWGPGRPGWHIECSVMASAILGPQIDVHSGGVDLMFPHHDNEIAQAEACLGCSQWVNYFLHTGHLHIEGLKMSKSLKNFISIDEALERFSARQLRLAFLLQPWNAKMDFKEAAMAEVKSTESTINNFFSMLKAHRSAFQARGTSWSDGKHYFHKAEAQVMSDLQTAQADFRKAMCDSFDTPTGFTVVLDLISKVNVYERNTKRSELEWSVLAEAGRWVTEMMSMLGLHAGPKFEGEIGWGSDTAGVAEGSSQNTEALLTPYLQALAGFRDEVRRLSRSSAPHSEYLKLADRLRDVELTQLGVALEDQEDGTSLVKLVPAEQLLTARAEKEQAAADKEKKKKENQEKERQKKLEQLEKGRFAPADLFRHSPGYKGQFKEFDEESGMPTKDEKGEELSKSKKKALEKERKNQEKLHKAFLEAKEKGEVA